MSQREQEDSGVISSLKHPVSPGLPVASVIDRADREQRNRAGGYRRQA